MINVFRMLGRCRGNRVSTKSSGGVDLDEVRDRWVRAGRRLRAGDTRCPLGIGPRVELPRR